MSERKLVPNIRFKGFEEDWEKLKLKSCVDRIKGNDGRMDLPTLTISASNGWMSQKERFSSNIAGKEQKNYTLLKKGELAYNHGNSRLAPYGTVFELKNYKEALVPRVYHSFKTKFMIKADFLEYLFHSKKIDQELRKLITSGARMDGLLNISYDSFTSITVKAPNTSEQQKIGGLFAKLDRLLDLQQQKLDQLELLKKALLQKLFPKQDAKIPELRFKGFEEEWKTDKLGKVTKYVKGFAFKSKDYTNTGIRIVRVTDLTDNKIDELKKDSTFVSLKTAESYQKYRLYKGDIIITTVGSKTELKSSSVGRAIFVSKSVNYLLNQNLVKLSTINKFNSPFVYFLLCKPNYSNYISRIERGNANQANIAIDDLWKYKFKIPQFSEQQKIGNLLAKIDRLIELENKKFSNLKLVKKSLLQNMFVE